MHGEIPGEEKEDISLTPMAMPILAGPGAMSLAIGFSTHGQTFPHYIGFVLGFAAIALFTWICFRESDAMVRVLNVNAIGALNRGPDPWSFFNHERSEFSRIGSGFAGESPCRYYLFIRKIRGSND